MDSSVIRWTVLGAAFSIGLLWMFIVSPLLRWNEDLVAARCRAIGATSYYEAHHVYCRKPDGALYAVP